MSGMRRLSRLLLVLALVLASASSLVLARQKVVLEWTTWHVNEKAQVEMMTDFIEAFKKLHPEVDIKLTGNPWSEYFDKLQVRMAGGNHPDIFACSQDNFSRYYQLGFTEQLDRHIRMAGYKGKFIDVADLTRINGKTYGVVYLTLPFTLIYNKVMFQKYGLKVPTTPEELLEVGKKMTIPGEQYGYSGAIDPSNPADFFTEILVWTLGYNGKLARKGMPTINEPQNVQAITMLKRAVDEGIMPKGIDRQVYRKMQLAGKLAMLVDGPYYFDWVRQESEQAYQELDAAPIFFPNKTVRTYTVYQCVAKGSKQKAMAAKFLEFMLRPENQEQFIPRVKQAPAMRDVKIPDAWLRENPWYRGYMQIVPGSVVPEGLEIYTEDIKKLVARYVGESFTGGKPVKETLDACQAAVIELLKSRGYKFPAPK